MSLTDETESTKTTTESKHQSYGKSFPKQIILSLWRILTDSLFLFLLLWSIVLVAVGAVVRQIGIEPKTYGYFAWYGTLVVFAIYCLYDLTKHK